MAGPLPSAPWHSGFASNTRRSRGWQSRGSLGANWSAFASDLRAVGGFDPRFGPGAKTGSTGAETEMQRRLGRRGVAAYYVPEAVVRHRVAAECGTPEWVLRRIYRHGIEWGLRRGTEWPWTVAALCGRLEAAGPCRLGGWLARSRSAERRFHARFLQAKWRGRLEGLRLARQWPATVDRGLNPVPHHEQHGEDHEHEAHDPDRHAPGMHKDRLHLFVPGGGIDQTHHDHQRHGVPEGVAPHDGHER